MKRLIRKANESNEMKDLIIGLSKWCQYEFDALDVDKLIELNQDCVFNGKLYRGMGIQGFDFLDMLDESGLEAPITLNELAKYIETECVYVEDNYSSFTKELEQAQIWNETQDFNNSSLSYIIETKASGIDVEKIYNKWKDDPNMDQEAIGVLKDCLFIKEVIAKINSDFKVRSIQNNTDFSKTIETREELETFLNV